MKTELIYMHHMQQTTCESTIINIKEQDSTNGLPQYIIILDRTVFYPQGGGQPYDIGHITFDNGAAVFEVAQVYIEDGIVEHIGTFNTDISTSELESYINSQVTCGVDTERRNINTRNHSAGHVLDMCLRELGINWTPGKGYHYPEGAYVEYIIPPISRSKDRSLLEDLGALSSQIENKANEIISRHTDTSITFLEEQTNGKPTRLVHYGDYASPCGGTHVANLSDIGHLTIRKIKKDKDKVKVSYAIDIPIH